MLGEEVEMEVKPSPRLLANNGNAKGTQLDKAKDNFRTPGNGSQRYNKRRDPAQQRHESTGSARKPQPQKFKGLDKRPRGRNAQWNGRRDEVTQVQRVEYGSALPNGPKKVNLNHLINFTFAPRDSYGDGSGSGGSLSGRNRWNRRRPRYNKEQFLQANCQFVVKADHDYTVHAADADILVEWDLIEQVRIFSHEEPSCPICLYPPTAAKITRCGHVYCWSCILHYLSLGDRSWRKCPICYESIIGKDLKSVVTVATHSYCVGEQVAMRLMKREKGSVVAVPVSHILHKMNDPFKMGDAVTKESFVKLLTTTQSQILTEIIKPEKEILQVQLATCEEDFERTFVEAAIKLHQEREDALISQTVVPTVSDHEIVETANPVEQDVKHLNLTTKSKNCFAYASAFSDEEDVEEKKSAALSPRVDASLGLENQQITVQQSPETQDTVKDGKLKDSDSKDDELKEGDVKADRPKEGDTKDDKLRDGDSRDGINAEVERNRRRRQSSENEHTYYFYQAADSQPMYIHSLNARCLVSEYGSLAKCPETITGEVIEIDHLTMTEELRKRFRYLKHLPLTCEFCVCELRLKPPIISKETIQAFSADFHKKKRARDKKVREEKKREQKIELEEDRKQGLYPSPNMSIRSHTHFPEFSTPQPSLYEESCVRSVSPTSSIESGSIVHDENAVYESGHGDSAVASSVDSTSDVSMSTPSFAQMLRTSPAKAEAWPNLSSLQSTKPTVVSAALPWPKSHVAGDLDGSDEENEDYVPVPTYKDSFSNAIQVALDKAAVRGQGSFDEDPLSSSENPKGQKGKKGKKKQKQLLFSTAGQRFK